MDAAEAVSGVRPRVYLAGPDVFWPDAVARGEAKKAICAAHGLDGVFPLDPLPDDHELSTALAEVGAGAGPALAAALFDLCIAHMDRCDAAIANLTPFRGPSADVGTAVEIGYLHGCGKPVFGYSDEAADYVDRVDPDGLLVEDFGQCDNLMVAGVVLRGTGEPPVRAVPMPARGGDDEAVDHVGEPPDLDSFTRCVQQAARYLGARSSDG